MRVLLTRPLLFAAFADAPESLKVRVVSSTEYAVPTAFPAAGGAASLPCAPAATPDPNAMTAHRTSAMRFKHPSQIQCIFYCIWRLNAIAIY